jgi:hypothetical protein
MLRAPMTASDIVEPLRKALARVETIARNPPEPRSGWPLPRVLEHCAQSIEFSMDGFPKLKPWLVRATVGKLIGRRFIARGTLRHDLTAPIPGAPAPGATTLEPALDRLRGAIARFTSGEVLLAPHFAFGDLSKADYARVHALHIADHLRAFEVGEERP